MIAPALKLDIDKGREIVLMLLSPPAKPHNVSVEKTVLAIPGEEATMTFTAESGELRCPWGLSPQRRKGQGSS